MPFIAHVLLVLGAVRDGPWEIQVNLRDHSLWGAVSDTASRALIKASWRHRYHSKNLAALLGWKPWWHTCESLRETNLLPDTQEKRSKHSLNDKRTTLAHSHTFWTLPWNSHNPLDWVGCPLLCSFRYPHHVIYVPFLLRLQGEIQS